MTTTTTPNKTNGGTVSRMTLGNVKTVIERKPDRILLVGTEGVGKTSFAADAPSPIFICAEDGLPPVLGSVARFPEPRTLEDVMEALRVLVREPHDYRTVVIDTLDWLEPIIHADLCQRHGWVASKKEGAAIEAPGYGKGYVAALEEWRRLLAALDVVRAKRGMEVILLAHAQIKNFANPAGDDYARYEAKMNQKAAALIKEWTDVNLFAVHDEVVSNVKGGKAKGVSSGRRVIHTERCAAWDAKNRHGLPEKLPLCYADYAEARAKAQPADPEALWAEGLELLAASKLDDETAAKTRAWLETAKAGGAVSLARAVDTMRSRVTVKGGEL